MSNLHTKQSHSIHKPFCNPRAIVENIKMAHFVFHVLSELEFIRKYSNCHKVENADYENSNTKFLVSPCSTSPWRLTFRADCLMI